MNSEHLNTIINATIEWIQNSSDAAGRVATLNKIPSGKAELLEDGVYRYPHDTFVRVVGDIVPEFPAYTYCHMFLENDDTRYETLLVFSADGNVAEELVHASRKSIGRKDRDYNSRLHFYAGRELEATKLAREHTDRLAATQKH